MAVIRSRGEIVRNFLIAQIDSHPGDVVRVAAEKFDLSRQAVHKHLSRLIAEGAVVESGNTRSKRYRLAALASWRGDYEKSSKPSEDLVWSRGVSPVLGPMASNVLNIWHYGITEMFNNALDHAEARSFVVTLERTAAATEVSIFDNGVGIFRKIQAALDLLDERHSVLELAKGKFTTDPKNHSGEGIFFSSRMFDGFEVLSGGVYFSHDFGKPEDWIVQSSREHSGTLVRMRLQNHTSRTTGQVFDRFSIGDDYGFLKTVVPVRLTQYGDDNLVSRSQAKRLLTRIERFKVVVFDFAAVTTIGQAFADEVFRVFAHQHPGIEITAINTGSAVKRMIARAQSHDPGPGPASDL